MARRMIVADDHPLFRAALTQVLSPGAEILGAGDLDELFAHLKDEPDIDLVLLDLNIPGAQGYSGLIDLRTRCPEVPVLVVSASGEPDAARRCRELGAAGYLGKSAPVTDIRDAVDTVLAGGTWPRDGTPNPGVDRRRIDALTPRQIKVLAMMSDGLMNKQIAHALGISEATVKVHVSAILQKLGVDSRTQAVIVARSLAG